MSWRIEALAVADALPWLERGELVRLLPAKTRAFVDFVTGHFRRERLAERFAGSQG